MTNNLRVNSVNFSKLNCALIRTRPHPLSPQYEPEPVPKQYIQQLQDIVARDPLAPTDELSNELVWRFR